MKIIQFVEHQDQGRRIQYVLCDDGNVYERKRWTDGTLSVWVPYITAENMEIAKKY